MNTVNEYYKVGAGKKVIPYLTYEMTKQKENDFVYRRIKAYVDDNKKVQNFNGNIITTHIRFLCMNVETYKDYEIVVDEDIMRNLLMIASISVEKLLKIERKLNLSEQVKEKIKLLCEYGNKSEIEYMKSETISDLDSIYDEITDIDKVDCNLYGLLKANYFAVGNNTVSFIDEKKLLDRKIIILSATIDHKLY